MLKGKTAIVTGGTRGIGFAIVKVFLQNGAKVALFGSRQETARRGNRAVFLCTDGGSPRSLERQNQQSSAR